MRLESLNSVLIVSLLPWYNYVICTWQQDKFFPPQLLPYCHVRRKEKVKLSETFERALLGELLSMLGVTDWEHCWCSLAAVVATAVLLGNLQICQDVNSLGASSGFECDVGEPCICLDCRLVQTLQSKVATLYLPVLDSSNTAKIGTCNNQQPYGIHYDLVLLAGGRITQSVSNAEHKVTERLWL